MSKLWLVAQYEYKRHVFKKSFILAILSVPLLIAFSFGMGWLVSMLQRNDTPVGYVDQAGLLADPVPAPKRGGSPEDPSAPSHVPLMSFPSEEAARQALESGEIQAYYLVTASYFKTNRVELVYMEPPNWDVTSQFWDFMQINRLTDLPPDVARRAVSGSNLIVRWPDDVPGGGREFSQRTFFNQFVPLFLAIAFIFLLFISSGFLMGAVAEEKENRTMEILATSLSSAQLMGGKILAVVATSLTQVLAWAVFIGLAVLVGGHGLGVEPLQNLSLDPQIILKMTVVAIPTFAMIAALMIALGVTVAEPQEAQQTMGLFIQPFMIPFWFLKPLIESPNSPLALGLSFFPITALSALCVRVAFSQVPNWQIAVSVAILSVCALGAVWLAGRAFRLGMLRYGQQLNWRQLFNKAQMNADSF
jgi:ABC-2 type transport system permease protein